MSSMLYIFQIKKWTIILILNSRIIMPSYEPHIVLNDMQPNCMFQSLFSLTPKKTSDTCITGLFWEEPTGGRSEKGNEFPCDDVIMNMTKNLWPHVDVFGMLASNQVPNVSSPVDCPLICASIVRNHLRSYVLSLFTRKSINVQTSYTPQLTIYHIT